MDNSFLHSKKLLLVDDEPELLKMVSSARLKSTVQLSSFKVGASSL